MANNNLGLFGCCLSCEECGCCDTPCPVCLCRKCSWYSRYVGRRRCKYLLFKEGKVWFGEDIWNVMVETEKTILIKCVVGKDTNEERNNEVWLPKSQIKISTARLLFDKEVANS